MGIPRNARICLPFRRLPLARETDKPDMPGDAEPDGAAKGLAMFLLLRLSSWAGPLKYPRFG
jgi:hypothetical protein